MKKALYIIGGISLGGMVLFPMGSLGNANDYFNAMGACAFIGAALDLLLGIILLLISLGAHVLRPYARACLLVAGLLLCGFTLCSTTHYHMGHM